MVGLAVVVAVAVIGALLLAGRGDDVVGTPRVPVLGPSRAVYDGDIGDPFVLPVTAGKRVLSFMAFGTGNRPDRVPTARSSDLVTWQAGPDALPRLPAWAAPDPRQSLSWAPAALQTKGGFLLYVTLPHARSGQQCIGLARSPVPEGPYEGVGAGPLLCQHDLGGSIDPAITLDRKGRAHMLWKNDGNAVGLPSSLWEQELTADGLGLVGPAHRLLTDSRPWQGGIIENPALIPASRGGWWLFYSANSFSKPEYATGVAYCRTLDEPCQETADGPLLATPLLRQENQFAPGGLDTVRDAGGDLWAVFHTWNRPTRNGRFSCCRSMQLARVLSA